MSMYYGLKFLAKEDRTRTIDGLPRLRQQISNDFISRFVKNSLILATWDARDFGAAKLNSSPCLKNRFIILRKLFRLST